MPAEVQQRNLPVGIAVGAVGLIVGLAEGGVVGVSEGAALGSGVGLPRRYVGESVGTLVGD